MALSDSDIPETILYGCKTPYSTLVRSMVAAVVGILWFMISKALKRTIVRKLNLWSSLGELLWVVGLSASVMKLAPTLWTLISDKLRSCHWYRRFKQFYSQEMMQKGMTKELAIADALKEVEMEKRMSTQRSGLTSNRR